MVARKSTLFALIAVLLLLATSPNTGGVGVALAATQEPVISAQEWLGNTYNSVKASVLRTFAPASKAATDAQKYADTKKAEAARATRKATGQQTTTDKVIDGADKAKKAAADAAQQAADSARKATADASASAQRTAEQAKAAAQDTGEQASQYASDTADATKKGVEDAKKKVKNEL